MYILGFTNVYYTLWHTDEPKERLHIYCGSKVTEVYQVFSYMQNLSMDYNKALEKIKEKAAANGEYYQVDLELKGTWSFERILSTRKHTYEVWQFTFGQLQGADIREATDVWQLTRAMQEEKGGRRRVMARRRLIELGELVRNVYRDQDCTPYITPTRLRFLHEKANSLKRSGHYFNDGERIQIAIKELRDTNFETQWGRTWIVWYEMENGQQVKYKGSNPPHISRSEYTQVTATVKHTEYKGAAETMLQRIKVK